MSNTNTARIIDTWKNEKVSGPTVTHWHIGSGAEVVTTVTFDPSVSGAGTPEEFLADYLTANKITLAVA